MSTLSYRRDIDGLRAVAVVPVVLGHAGLPLFAGGFVGVDVFFVISGYLITAILLRELNEGRFSIASFYERRARRILPALYAVLAATLLAGAFVMAPDELNALSKSTGATVLFVSNLWFLRESLDYFGTDAALQPLLHTWSLAVEEQFYILFPLILWAVSKVRRLPLVPVLVLIAAASLALSVHWTSTAAMANFFLLPSRAWELALGALLAAGAVPASRSPALTGAVSAAGLALIVLPVVLYDEAVAFPGLAAVPPCLGAAALIWAGMGGATPLANRLLSLAPFVGIGLISYSLYLWHWPVLVLARLVTGQGDLPLAAAVASVVLATGLATLSWAFVERPFRRRGPEGWTRRGIFVASATGACLLLAVSGLTHLSRGFPGRLSDEVRMVYLSGAEATSPLLGCPERSEPLDRACRIGAVRPDGPWDVLVWGDSHAAAALPGIDAALREAGLSGIALMRRGCGPVLDLFRGEEGDDTSCARFNRRVMRVLRERDDLGIVLLHGRWSSASGDVERPPEARSLSDVVLGRHRASPQADGNAAGRAAFARAFDRTLAEIAATGRRVLIVGSVPEIGWRVPTVIARSDLLRRAPPEPPETAALRDRYAAQATLFAAAADSPGVAVVDPVEAMCAERCAVTRDGRALYRDDDHLSVFGAETLFPPLLREPLSALAGPS